MQRNTLKTKQPTSVYSCSQMSENGLVTDHHRGRQKSFIFHVHHTRHQSIVLSGAVQCGTDRRQAAQAAGRKHGALHPQKPLRLIRDREVQGLGILYLTPTTRYTVNTGMILH